MCGVSSGCVVFGGFVGLIELWGRVGYRRVAWVASGIVGLCVVVRGSVGLVELWGCVGLRGCLGCVGLRWVVVVFCQVGAYLVSRVAFGSARSRLLAYGRV